MIGSPYGSPGPGPRRRRTVAAGGRVAPLLLATLLSAAPAAWGGVPTAGELLVVSPSAPVGPYPGALLSINLQDEIVRIVHYPAGLRVPDAISWGARKTIYVTDGDRLLVIDPYAGPLAQPAEIAHPYFRRLTDMEPDGAGGFYLLDGRSDPLGDGGLGAVFHFDPEEEQITLICSDFRFGAPHRLFVEPSGTLLVLDPWGKAVPGGERLGAIFRVDPQGPSVTTVTSLEWAADPQAVMLLAPDTLLVLDADATVPGFKEFSGAVIKLDPQDFSLIDTLAVEEFRNPSEMVVDQSGTLYVLDEVANPASHPGGSGVIFVFDPQSWTFEKMFDHPVFTDLTALGWLGGSELSDSEFFLEDDQAPLLPGDRIEFRAMVINSGFAPSPDVVLSARFNELTCFFPDAQADRGTLSFDQRNNELTWGFDVDVPDTARLTVDLQVPWPLDHGTWLRVPIEVEGPGGVLSEIRVERLVHIADQGDVIFADAGTSPPAPRLFSLLEGTSMPVTVPVNPADSLGSPADLTFGPDGTLYVLDGRIGRNGLLAVDPTFGTVTVLHRGAPLTHARALCLAHDGALLIADPHLPPPFTTGGVYRYDLITRELTEFFVHSQISDPVDICPDRNGHYLITDYTSAISGHEGAIVEVDEDGDIQFIYSSPFLRDPISTAVTRPSTFYVVDTGFADDPSPWMVMRVTRDGAPGYSAVASFDPNPFVRPYGIAALSPTELWVCERSRNPLYYNSGAIVQINDEQPGWSWEYVSFESDLRDPERLAVYQIPDLFCASLSLTDLNGGRTVPGDTLRAQAQLNNLAPVTAARALAQFSWLGSLRPVSSEAERGTVLFDPDSDVLQWSGDARYLDPFLWTAEFVIDELAPHGEEIQIRVELPGTEREDTRVYREIDAPLRGGEFLALDSRSDPFGSGHFGALYLLGLQGEPMTPLASHAALRSPADLLSDGPDRALILDSEADPLMMGEDTGGLYVLDPEDSGLQLLSAGAAYVDPTRVRAHPDGGWLVMDPAAAPCGGAGRGAVFRLPSHGGPPDTLSCDAAFGDLRDMAVDDLGRAWVTDGEADPGNTGADNIGAIFALDLASGALVDTVASAELLTPTACEWLPDGTLLFADQDWTGPFGNLGLRRYHPSSERITTVLNSPYLSTPTRLTVISPSEVLVVDSTGWYPGYPDASGMIFRLDLETRVITPFAEGPEGARLVGVGRIPLPALRIARMQAAADSAGMYVAPGDTLDCELMVVNDAPTAEPVAVLELVLDPTLVLDASSLSATAGTITTTADGLSWEGELDGGGSVIVSYRAVASPAPGLASWGSQAARVSGVFAPEAARTITHHISTSVGPSELVVLDSWADPRGFGFATGALFRLEGSTRDAAPLLADSAFTSPVGVARVPGSLTDFLIVDADSDVSGSSRGALFRASTRTGEVELVFTDTTMSQPIALAVVDSTLCYMLDEMADPLRYQPEGGQGPGAIYRIDLQARTGEVFFSDTAFARPSDIDVDPLSGRLYVIDKRAGGDGQYTGAVFAIDPSGQSFETLVSGEPLMSPRCGKILDSGELIIADPFPAGGTLFRMDGEGHVEPYVICAPLVAPSDIVIGSRGRPLVIDAQANPMDFMPPMGSIFRFFPEEDWVHCSLYKTGPPFVRPRSASIHFEGATPVQLIAFELFETAGGVTMQWQLPGELAGADCFVYRRTPEIPGDNYVCLNREDPVGGSGELYYLDRTALTGETYEYLLLAIARDGQRHEFGPYTIRTVGVGGRFALERVSPNPFLARSGGDGLAIRFSIPPPGGKVQLGVFDVTGRLRRHLVDDLREPGRHAILWDGRDQRGARLASGLYFLRLQAGHHLAQRRVLLMR